MERQKINLSTLKKSSWTDQELLNVELLADFIQHLMIDHDFDYMQKVFASHDYTQHNRGIKDGMPALIKYVEDFAKRYPDYTYDVKHIYADGDFVTFHSHATIKRKHRGNDKMGLNIVDIWRVSDGQIAEHWDSLQPLDWSMRLFVWLNGGKLLNSNGVF